MTGTLPPLSEAAWQAEFDKYKTIPQFQQRNSAMTLHEFKTIFWWEWAHRLMGRVIGAAFLLPFLCFLAKGWIGPACAGGCGRSSPSARCRARSAGGWSPPGSPTASRSRSIGSRRTSSSPA